MTKRRRALSEPARAAAYAVVLLMGSSLSYAQSASEEQSNRAVVSDPPAEGWTAPMGQVPEEPMAADLPGADIGRVLGPLPRRELPRFSSEQRAELAEAAFRRRRATYRLEQFRAEHEQAVFEWQHTSSQVLFWFVLCMTVVAIYMAWWQLRRAGVSPADRAGTEGEAVVASAPVSGADDGVAKQQPGRTPTDPPPVSTLKLSAAGVEVSSPLLGVLILAMAGAFLYAYLSVVYPINVIRSDQQTAGADAE